MADVKDDYSKKAADRKIDAARDSMIADLIQRGYLRKEEYGSEWETVDINDVVNAVVPGATSVVIGGKVIFTNSEMKRAVVADVSGYLRIQDLTRKTARPQYLDKFGNDVRNIIDRNGKTRGRTRAEYQRATHFIIKKREV